MLITYWIWNSLSLRLRSGGSKSDHTDKPHMPDPKTGLPFTTRPFHDAIDVFDRPALLELRRAARLQPVIKTSFSRSNPVPRG